MHAPAEASRSWPPRRFDAAQRLAGVALVVAALTLVASCGSSDRGAGRVGPGTGSTTTTSAGGPLPPTGTCTTPTDASRTVVTAWIANDRMTAGRCATPDAVAILFADPGRAAGWIFQGCDGPDPGVPVCSFASQGRTARFTLHGTEAAGWAVDRVELHNR